MRAWSVPGLVHSSKKQTTWSHLEGMEVAPPIDGRAWGDERKLDPRYVATMAMYSIKTRQLIRPEDVYSTPPAGGRRATATVTATWAVGATQQSRSKAASPTRPPDAPTRPNSGQRGSPTRVTPDHLSRGRRRPASASASRPSSRPGSAKTRPESASCRGSGQVSPSSPTAEPPKPPKVEFEYGEVYSEEKRAWVSYAPSLNLVPKTPSESPLPPDPADRPEWMEGGVSVSPPRPPLPTRAVRPMTGAARLRKAVAAPVSRKGLELASPPKDSAISSAQERLVRVRSARPGNPVKETLRPTPFSVPYQPNQPEVADAAGLLPPRRTTWDVGVQVRRSLAAPSSTPLLSWVATVDYATSKLYYVNTTGGLSWATWTPPPGFDGTFVTADDHPGLPCAPEPPAHSGKAGADEAQAVRSWRSFPNLVSRVRKLAQKGDTARQIDGIDNAKRAPQDEAGSMATPAEVPAADVAPEIESRAPVQTGLARGCLVAYEGGAAGKGELDEVPPPAKSFYTATPTARAAARTFEIGDKVVLAKWAEPSDGVAFLVKSAAPQYGSYVVEIRGRSHDQVDAPQ